MANSKECCLCGDVGFPNDLLLCPICGFRLQHTYCSASYPNIDLKVWRCEWCAYEQEKPESAKAGQAADCPAASASEERRSTRRRSKDDDKRPLRVVVASPTKLKKAKGADRGWRRLRNCNTTSSRVIGRRYKLLADVLC